MSRAIQTTNWAATPIYYATAVGDQFDYRDVQSLATALIAHTHDGTNAGKTVAGIASGAVVASGVPTVEGQIGWDATNHTLSWFGTALRRGATWDGTETLTNKSFGTAATDDVKGTFILANDGTSANWTLKESVTAALVDATTHRLALKPAAANHFFQVENVDATLAFSVKAGATNTGSYVTYSTPSTYPGDTTMASLTGLQWYDHTTNQWVIVMKKSDGTVHKGSVALATSATFVAGAQPICAPTADPGATALDSSQLAFFLNEGGNTLGIRLRYSTGVTHVLTTPLPLT